MAIVNRIALDLAKDFIQIFALDKTSGEKWAVSHSGFIEFLSTPTDCRYKNDKKRITTR